MSKGVRNNLARWLKGVRKKEEGGEEGWGGGKVKKRKKEKKGNGNDAPRAEKSAQEKRSFLSLSPLLTLLSFAHAPPLFIVLPSRSHLFPYSP